MNLWQNCDFRLAHNESNARNGGDFDMFDLKSGLTNCNDKYGKS